MMSGDLRTIVWKEWHSLLSGRSRRQILIIGAVLILDALIFPIQGGAGWVDDPVPMTILGLGMPLVIVGVLVPDAIAGQRERHTLSTLLASRLPDRVILFGKLGFAVALGWLTTPPMLAISLVVANVVAGPGTLLLYDWVTVGWILLAGLLVAVLTGGIGIFVSLQARTAQEAQQLTLIGLMLPVFIIPAVLMLIGSNAELGRQAAELLRALDMRLIAGAALGLLAIVDAGLLWAADRRFRRGRLLFT
jgi:ABC-2 type transport system permease protein